MTPQVNEILEYISDEGDETQRNFRYQHCFGALLLIAGAVGKYPYKNIWCEHHEDLLVEKENDKFEGFQIKTRQSETGYWLCSDEGLRKSIKRFTQLNKNFGDQIEKLHFVSNTECLDVGDEVKADRLKRSPRKFLENVEKATDCHKIPAPFDSVFEDLQKFCKCTKQELFTTLRKVKLVLSPARDAIDLHVSTKSLPKIDDCKKLPVHDLNSIRDELVQAIYLASSLRIDDPFHCLYQPDGKTLDPKVLSKKVAVTYVAHAIANYKDAVFRYQPFNQSLQTDGKAKSYSIIKMKFEKGLIEDHVQTMTRRALTAESRLFELASQEPEKYQERIVQLENVVQAECDEAFLETGLSVPKSRKEFGKVMLDKVFKKLKTVSEQKSPLVYNEPFETLVGVAGLLTESCTVWWSEKFDIKKNS